MKNIAFLIFVSLSIFCFNSCEHPTSPMSDWTTAPSRILPVREIMSAQGITSIHYMEYDSSVVNGYPDSSFVPASEIYIDSCRCKISNYSSYNKSWNTTVYDLRKNIAWDYSDGRFSYQQLSDLPTAYEQRVQWALGSSLNNAIKGVGRELVDGKQCDVFEDAAGYREWVWTKFRLPLQKRTVSNYDVYQIGVIRKHIIDINQPIPDSVFDPPK